jgi:K+-sensing histidine kinase KdpD
MDNFSSKDLIHVGAEAVVILGVAFYFNKKCNSLTERVGFLEQKILEHEEIVKALYSSIKSLEQKSCPVQLPMYNRQRERQNIQHEQDDKSDEDIIKEELENDNLPTVRSGTLPTVRSGTLPTVLGNRTDDLLKKKEKKVKFRDSEAE